MLSLLKKDSPKIQLLIKLDTLLKIFVTVCVTFSKSKEVSVKILTISFENLDE